MRLLFTAVLLFHGTTSTFSQHVTPQQCLPPTPTTTLAPVEANVKADIIFVLDTSPSMGAETNNIMSNLNAFGQHLENEGIDYRVIFVGKTQACCNICVSPPLASSNCGDTGTRYRHVNQLILSVDACSRMAESAMYAQYTSFLRQDAAKTIVFISDDGITDTEYDGSTNRGEYGCTKNSCKTVKATKWLNDLQILDGVKKQFAPTDILPRGVMVHTIDAHDCTGEHGHQRSYVYRGLAELTGGKNYLLCESDWTPYFSTIAGAVANTAVKAKCVHAVPRDSSDSALLVGRLEPDTPFSLRFVHDQSVLHPSGVITLSKSTTNTCFEADCTYSAHDCVCAMRCPVGYLRSGDGSVCRRANQPDCSLAYCHDESLHPGLQRCRLNNPNTDFIVNDPSDPTSLTFCSHACEVIRSFQQGGNISFAFHPVAKQLGGVVQVRGVGLARQKSYILPMHFLLDTQLRRVLIVVVLRQDQLFLKQDQLYSPTVHVQPLQEQRCFMHWTRVLEDLERLPPAQGS